jgi:hypothetical protein
MVYMNTNVTKARASRRHHDWMSTEVGHLEHAVPEDESASPLTSS